MYQSPYFEVDSCSYFTENLRLARRGAEVKVEVELKQDVVSGRNSGYFGS